jgi:hypothetical protein
MTSLLDLENAAETVKVGGKDIPVYGLSTAGIVAILRRFPQLREMLSGEEVELTAELLYDLAPDAVAALIAASCGHPGDETAERVASRLTITQQADLLEATIRLTMPDGLGPFVARLAEMGQAMGLSTDETADTTDEEMAA